MPIAAIPRYLLNADFSNASPGLRFGMYLRLWGVNRRTQVQLWTTYDVDYEVRGQQRQEREVKYENKVSALADAKRLNGTDREVMCSLLQRQRVAFGTVGSPASRACFKASAVAPFATGLGNEHPLENGFAFLNPYGVPYLPGSGVKGVVRRAAQELAEAMWEADRGWKGLDQGRYRLEVGKGKDKRTPSLSVIDVLFGLESGDGDTDHVRGALSFWDVIPHIEGDSLLVEVMTPHQSHYYQQKKEHKSGDSITPHDSGQPNPICFLTVPPASRFVFHVVCDAAHLKRLTEHKLHGAPDLLADADGGPLWRKLLASAFEHAFAWLGFGAKTAVGYGAMNPTRDEPSKAGKAAVPADEVSKKATAAETIWNSARLRFNAKNGTLTAVGPGNVEANALAPRGAELLATLPPDVQRKVKANEFVRVTASVRGTELISVEPKA